MTNSDSTGLQNSGTSKDQTENIQNSTTELRDVATALELLTADSSLENLSDIKTEGDVSDGRTSLPSREGIWSQVKLGKTVDEDASLSVTGHWSSHEPPRIELHVRADAADVTLSISPDRSRALAADLLLAAYYAEKGNDSS